MTRNSNGKANCDDDRQDNAGQNMTARASMGRITMGHTMTGQTITKGGITGEAFTSETTNQRQLSQPHTLATTRLLLTAFGPFPGTPNNISQDVVAATLQSLSDAQLKVGSRTVAPHSVVLPTDWSQAPVRLNKEIAAVRPDIVISFGVSRLARGLVVECLARNVADAPDVNGYQPDHTRLVPNGPAFVPARWPARAIVRTLRQADIPAVRSRNAGSYLCNAVLYQMLYALKAGAGEEPACSPDDGARAPGCGHGPRVAGFIHLPERLVATRSSCSRTPELRLEDAVKGARTVVDVLTRHITP